MLTMETAVAFAVPALLLVSFIVLVSWAGVRGISKVRAPALTFATADEAIKYAEWQKVEEAAVDTKLDRHAVKVWCVCAGLIVFMAFVVSR
jgi:hypothetical protein